ncbi:MAG: hypothetical protein B7Y80_19375, partial [Hyphomicrobium sp. 32-62-53]
GQFKPARPQAPQLIGVVAALAARLHRPAVRPQRTSKHEIGNETYEGFDLTNPACATEIAQRLLRSGRPKEALLYPRARPTSTIATQRSGMQR